jgi:hypothetical protein
MKHRALVLLAALCACLVTPALAAQEQRPLDLDIDPAQVARWEAGPPPHDLVIPAPAARQAPQPDAKPGWDLRPAVDVDVGRDADRGADPSGAGLDVGDLTIDLDSVGLRLQRNW